SVVGRPLRYNESEQRPACGAYRALRALDLKFQNREKIMRMLAFSGSSILGGVLAIALNVMPAQAQATRTWVSGVGDDANPCSRTAPCKTFAGAISKTATGGEINCLDPGGFGGVTITKSIQIICMVEAGVLVSGTNAIIVNAAAGSEILLDGLDIEGLSTGINGVNVLAANTVTIRNSTIKNFAQNGVCACASGARVNVMDSFLYSNAPSASFAGIQTVSGAVLLVNRTTIDTHAGPNINVVAGASLFLNASTLSGSATDVANAGNFTSYVNNALKDAGTPTATIPLR